MGWVLKLAGVVAISVMILGCNQINFGLGQQKDEFAAPNPDIGTNPDDQKKQEDPIPDPDLPPVDEPPPPPPALVYTNGNCADQETVLSCLKCDAPDVPPPHPPALSKAKKLAKIEELTCGIHNDSDPESKIFPTYDQLISRLAACTELMYPETSQTAVEASTIGLLIGEDNFLRNRLFSKLWYQLPYTDHFEFYFGLETKEARRIFCYKEDPSIVLKGPLLTTEYWQYCNGREAPNCLRWRQDKAAQARFSAPQVIRDQLRKCLDQTAVPTPPVETPVNPAPACQWEKIEGLMLGEKVFSEGMKLKNRGFVVSVETEVNCLPLDELLLNLDGLRNYKIAGYKCE